MKRSTFLTAAALSALLLVAGRASAADLSYTGNLASPHSVALFNFTVSSPSSVTLRTYSFAGGTNAAGTVIASGGFDPNLTLFDGSGVLIAENDDGGDNVPADIEGSQYDAFIQTILGAGNYTVSVQAFGNFANGPNLSNGFQGEGTFGGLSSFYALDILGLTSASAVPEPATWAMMLLGFGAAGYSLRRQRSQARVAYA